MYISASYPEHDYINLIEFLTNLMSSYTSPFTCSCVYWSVGMVLSRKSDQSPSKKGIRNSKS